MKLVDSDIVIDHFHGSRSALDYFSQTLAAGETLGISVITVTEILSGMRSGEEERTERLFKLFTMLNVSETIGRKAGTYLREYRLSHNLELGDALIAATAAQFDAELITRNLRHYPMTDIRVTAPYQRGSGN